MLESQTALQELKQVAVPTEDPSALVGETYPANGYSLVNNDGNDDDDLIEMSWFARFSFICCGSCSSPITTKKSVKSQ